MKTGHHVKISCGFYPYGGTKVEIDGLEIKELVDVTFYHLADGVATLVLKIYPSSLDLEGDVTQVDTIEEARDLGRQLVDVVVDKEQPK